MKFRAKKIIRKLHHTKVIQNIWFWNCHFCQVTSERMSIILFILISTVKFFYSTLGRTLEKELQAI